MKVRKVKLRDRDGTTREYWCADLRFRGKGTRKHFETKAEADAYVKRHGGTRKRQSTRPGRPPVIDHYIAELLAKRNGTIAPATYTVLAQQLGHLARFEFRPGVPLGTCRLDEFDGNVDLVLEAIKWMDGQGYAANTLRLFRNSLKELLDRAQSAGFVVDHPLHDPQLRRDLRNLARVIRDRTPEKVKAMTEEQARHFLTVAAAESVLYPLFLTGFGTGPRLGELLALQVVDDEINLIGGEAVRQLHIWRELTQLTSRRNPIPKRPKNGADYRVDVPEQVGRVLDLHKRGRRADVPWLFHTSTGSPYSHEHIQGEFQRVLRLARLDTAGSFSPHSMRHTFATMHIANGEPAKWVSEQLGHKDLTVTMRVYANAFRSVRPGAANRHGTRLFSMSVLADGKTMAKQTPIMRPETENAAPVLH